MGCTPSKRSVRRNCNSQCSPVRRSYSSHPHHSPLREDNKHHAVALTSTTLGYLLLDPSTKTNQVRKDPPVARILQEPVPRNIPEKNSMDFAVGVIESKKWSQLIEEKMTKIAPRTPIRTPPGEPETINAWELMEGLDDSSPFHPPSTIPLHQSTLPSQEKDRKFTENHSNINSNSNGTSIASESDPNTINIKPLISEKQQPADYSGDDANKSSQNYKNETVSRTKEKLILYFTSLRGVRKTYEDCCHVRVILKNSGIRVDERDVSMHSGFRDELKELLGDQYGCGGLPKVFVGRKYIGGADEIKRFHDEFQLDKVLEGCEIKDDCSGGSCDGCEACGNIRFLPCETCSGSCKVYYDVNSDNEEEAAEESDHGFQRCPDCNENGLLAS